MRFGIAFLLSGAVFGKRILKVDKNTLYRGMILGIWLYRADSRAETYVAHTHWTHIFHGASIRCGLCLYLRR